MLAVSNSNEAVVSSQAAVALANVVAAKQVEFNDEAAEAAKRRAAAQRKAQEDAARERAVSSNNNDVVSLSSKGQETVGRSQAVATQASASVDVGKAEAGAKVDIQV